MNRAILPLLLGLLLAPVLCLAAEPKAEEAKAIAEIEVEKLSFREPFTLKLRVDKEHYYEENFDRKIPFVAHNKVYLFAGESFGLKLGIANGEFSTVTYQKEKKGADIEAKFKQEMQANGRRHDDAHTEEQHQTGSLSGRFDDCPWRKGNPQNEYSSTATGADGL